MNRKTLKTIIIGLLALSLLFTTACTKSGGTAAEGEWTGRGGCYKKTAISELQNVVAVASYDGKIYAALDNGQIVEYENESLQTLYSSDGATIRDLSADERGLWFPEKRNFETDGVYTEESFLCGLSYNGEKLLEKQLDGEPIGVIANGGLYVYYFDHVDIFEPNGTLASSVELKNDLYRAAKKAGGISCLLLTAGGTELCDITQQGASELYGEELDADGVYPAFDGEKLLFTDDSGLYEYSQDGAKPLIIWAECGITITCLFSILPISQDTYICLDDNKVFLLEPADVTDFKPKTTIKLAMLDEGVGLEEYISRFNEQSDEYYIETENLASETENRDKALTLLNTQLISGGGPDIIMFFGLSPKSYAQKGYLLDLYELMKADGISKNDFMGFGSLEVDGKLPVAAPGFFIETDLGLESIFGEKVSWSFDEYFKMESSLTGESTMFYNMSRDGFLSSSLKNYIGSAIDWGKGTCDFENESFITLLEATKKMKESTVADELAEIGISAESRLKSGQIKLMGKYLTGIQDFLNAEETVGEELCPIGWPTSDGSCGSCIHFMPKLGINSQSENDAGAWAFIKYLITDPDIQKEMCSGSFPVLKSAYEMELGDLLHPLAEFKNAEIVEENGGFYADGQYYDMAYNTTPRITEKQIQKINKLISSITKTADYDSEISDIVKAECAAYFDGVQTVEETAKKIQQRVGIYVSEQS